MAKIGEAIHKIGEAIQVALGIVMFIVLALLVLAYLFDGEKTTHRSSYPQSVSDQADFQEAQDVRAEQAEWGR